MGKLPKTKYFGQLSLFMDKHKAEVRAFPCGKLVYIVGLFNTKEKADKELVNILKMYNI